MRVLGNILLLLVPALSVLAEGSANGLSERIVQELQIKLQDQFTKVSQEKLLFLSDAKNSISSSQVKKAVVTDLPEYVSRSFKPEIDALLIKTRGDPKSIKAADKEIQLNMEAKFRHATC